MAALAAGYFRVPKDRYKLFFKNAVVPDGSSMASAGVASGSRLLLLEVEPRPPVVNIHVTLDLPYGLTAQFTLRTDESLNEVKTVFVRGV